MDAGPDSAGPEPPKSERDREVAGIVFWHLGLTPDGDSGYIPPCPEWYKLRALAQRWELRLLDVANVLDMPLWWVERDSIAVEAENEVAKQRERDSKTNAARDAIHGGR